MKKTIFKSLSLALFFSFGCSIGVSAQGPGIPGGPGGPGGPPIGGPGPVISAPGSPAGIGQPNPGPPPPGPEINNGPAPAPGSEVYNPGPPPPGGPSPLLNIMAPLVVNAPLSSPNWQNAGTTNVVACGYDAQGVWRTIPLRVTYNYNGAQYNVTVDSAWNPWTDCWNYGIDVPAFNTQYFLNGTTFDFYVNLSTGTWYFNL